MISYEIIRHYCVGKLGNGNFPYREVLFGLRLPGAYCFKYDKQWKGQRVKVEFKKRNSKNKKVRLETSQTDF